MCLIFAIIAYKHCENREFELGFIPLERRIFREFCKWENGEILKKGNLRGFGFAENLKMGVKALKEW